MTKGYGDDDAFSLDGFTADGRYMGRGKGRASHEPDPDLFRRGQCYTSHPPLKVGGGVLLGGNCRDHVAHQGVDLYVALDGGHKQPYFEAGWSWDYLPRAVYYPIENMRIPNNVPKFVDLIDVIVAALGQGKKVHVGCIGGHGRTGLVLAAVVAKLGIAGKENDAIGWVRENYCKRAVETTAQENFLVVNFGAKPVRKGQGKVDKLHDGF